MISAAKLIPVAASGSLPSGEYFILHGLGNLYGSNYQQVLAYIDTSGKCPDSSDGKFSPNCWNDPKLLYGKGTERRAFFDKTITPETSTQRNCYNKHAENQHGSPISMTPPKSSAHYYQKFQCDQGRTTDELKDPATYAGWSTDDWDFESGTYPRLKVRE